MGTFWKNAVIRYKSDILFRAEIHRKADLGSKAAHSILLLAKAK